MDIKNEELELTPELFQKLDDSEKNAEKIVYESKTYFQDAWNSFKKNKMAVAGLIFIIIMVLCCIFIPIISPYTYDGQNMSIQNQGPTLAHLMGTDRFGRDILVRVMCGGRISLSVGVVGAFISLVIGVVYGCIAGNCGGKLDKVMIRFV
jgi:oligopeptide transport system permease protein